MDDQKSCMPRNRALPFVAGLIGMLVLSAPGACEEVYKWIDRNGVTHFSGTPPPAEFAGVEVIELSDLPPASPRAAADYQAMLDVAASIEQSRLQRQRLRLEQQRLAREAALARDRYEPPVSERSYAVQGLYYPRHYRYPLPRHRYRHYRGPFLEHMPRVRPPAPSGPQPIFSRHDPGR
jgi:hypothetical protein